MRTRKLRSLIRKCRESESKAAHAKTIEIEGGRGDVIK